MELKLSLARFGSCCSCVSALTDFKGYHQFVYWDDFIFMQREPWFDRKVLTAKSIGALLMNCFPWHVSNSLPRCNGSSCAPFNFAPWKRLSRSNQICRFVFFPLFCRKDDRGQRFWLEKPAIDWMHHIDLKRRIIIWAAFDFPELSYPDFGLLSILREWKDGISLLRRTSSQSGAPWCTEPPLGSLPRATALCSTPATSRRGNTTPRTYQWLPTQVSQTSTGGVAAKQCRHWHVLCSQSGNIYLSQRCLLFQRLLQPKFCAMCIYQRGWLWPV